jgi:6-phosphogluconolactonase
MIEAEWLDYDTADEMTDAVVDDVSFVVATALNERGVALVALPGGKSPVPIYRRLAEAAIDWPHVTIIPTDDRMVPANSPLSNVAMIARHFEPKGARVLPLTLNGECDYQTAGKVADAQLSGLNWPLDLVWLGVGVDGHTASIFPGPDLEQALDGPPARKALGVMPDPLPPEAPVARVTLSRAGIVSSRVLLLALSGAEKRAVVERALENGPLSATPIGRVLAAAESPVLVHWSAT